MGTGTRIEASSGIAPKKFSTSFHARNLTKNQLGGVIFGCKNSTIKECLFKQIFGLPAHHFSYVKNIDPGLPLFLFNYSDRKLHGIFEAACSGQMNINPYGWTTDGSERTLFPAQVQIRVRLQCQPLLESQFKPIIADNYYNDNHFWFEVDHVQAKKLMTSFASLAVAPGTSVLPNTMKWRSMFRAISSRDTRDESEELPPLDSEADVGNQSSQKSDSTDVPSSLDGESYQLEAQLDEIVVQQEEKNDIYMKLKELALKKVNSEHQNMHILASAEDTATTSDTQVEDKFFPRETIVGSGQNSSATNDNFLKDQVYSGKPLVVEDQCEQIPGPSSEMSLITRLLQEVEELKVFKTDQTQKISVLEQKLVRAESEIQLLKTQLRLEPEANPSMVRDDEKVVESFDELDLDHKESIFLLGGYDGESWLSAFDSYYPSHNVLKSFQPMNSIRSYTAVAWLNGEIYAIGGGNDHGWYDTVESYSLARNQWTLCPSLSQNKGSLAAASINNKIFAMGGGNGIECFSNVEMLDLDVGRWIHTRSMLQKRFSFAAAELNGVIYATGGFDGTDYLKSVEMFDPREHSWTKISCMNTRRGCHSLVVLNEKLYAVGGFDGNTMVPTVEIFDPRLGSWMSGEPMNYSRGYLVSAAINNTIYAIGGVRDGDNIVNAVESYKEGQGWEEINGCSMRKRCFHSGIALSP